MISSNAASESLLEISMDSRCLEKMIGFFFLIRFEFDLNWLKMDVIEALNNHLKKIKKSYKNHSETKRY